jgi:hypothetical protein
MMVNSKEISICPNCGSTNYLPDYPTPGQKMCTDCFREIINLKINPENYVPDKCPSCGDKDIYWIRDEETDTFAVMKCEKCSKIAGYTKPNFQDDYSIAEVDDGYYGSFEVKLARKEGKPVISAARHKELAKELEKKQNSPEQKCLNYVSELFENKTEILLKVRILPNTLNRALGTVRSFIREEGVLTENQTTTLAAASIPFFEEIQFKRREISKCYATERVIAEIFNVDRKTIRKWKKTLKDHRPSPTVWSSFTYFKNGSSSYANAELPTEVESVTKLTKPSILKDDYEVERLVWRVKYKDGSWTDLSDGEYKYFKGNYWESGGKLELP